MKFDTNNQKTISGAEAIARMRLMKNIEGAYFRLMHYTYQRSGKAASGRLRKVEQCRLRKQLKREHIQYDPDMYLLYTDLVINAPRMCFKRLLHSVAFPPDYEWLRVDWYIKYRNNE